MSRITKNILVAICYLIPLVLYCYTLLTYNVNIPKASDDVRCFIYQFINDYLYADSIVDKFYYLFEVSTWPHPKIQARVLCILNYHLIGEINFKFMNICGSLFHLGFIYVMFRISKLSPLQFLPIFLFLCIPLRQFLLWSVSNTGSLNLIFMALMFHTLSKKQYIQSGIYGFLNSFSNGIGFIVFPIAYLLLMIEQKKFWVINSRKLFIWALIGAISVISFYFIVFYGLPERPSSSADSGGFQISYVASILAYFLTFLGSSIGNYFDSIYLSFSVGLLAFVALWISRNQILKNQSLLGLLVYCLIIGLMVAVMRSDYSVFFEHVWPRHEKYSALFIALTCLFFIKSMDSKNVANVGFGSVLITSIVLFGIRFNRNYQFHNKTQGLKLKKIRGILEKDKQTKIFASLKEASQIGLYHPPKNLHCIEQVEFDTEIHNKNQKKLEQSPALVKGLIISKDSNHIKVKLNAQFIGSQKEEIIKDVIIFAKDKRTNNEYNSTYKLKNPNFNMICIYYDDSGLPLGEYTLFIEIRNAKFKSRRLPVDITFEYK